jgi:sigma-E factor negative regulatory protein RseA
MNPASQSGAEDDARRAERLSALADGELDAAEVQLGCLSWRDDATARSTWHVYHVIGDALRSEHLRSPPQRDAAFLGALRGRLAQEPTVLAPSSLARARRDRMRRWVAAIAVAGGVAAVVGVMLPMRGLLPTATDPGTTMAARDPAGGSVQRVGASPGPAQVLVIDGNIIRDARLDAYFDAHRGAGAMPSAMPGGALRSVDMIAPVKR